MKFGHLLECNMKNIFLEKTNTKCGRKTLFPDPFLKNQNSFMQFAFIVCQAKSHQNILKLSCIQLAFTSYKA